MKHIYRQKDVLSISNRNIFVDANIIIYLYFAYPATKYYSTIYGLIFRDLLKNNNNLYTDYNVISEVINRELKLNYNIYKASTINPDGYKDWRSSVNGQNVETQTYSIIKYLLSIFNIEDKVYDKTDILSMLVINNQDFTDKAIVNLCQEKNFILLTNDKDFSGADLEIISENPKLI